ncbi:MAG: hypothetical protein AAGF55_03900 [Pseudomonadota bacterium]
MILKILVLFALCGPIQAEDLLPVVLEHKSVAFPVDTNQPPLPVGARVEFIVQSINKAPKTLSFPKGFVLGQSGGFHFIEIRDGYAARMVKLLHEGRIKYRKISDPSPEDVAARKEMADGNNMFQLAPSMRELTITLPVESEIALGWVRGETLTFQEAARRSYWSGETYYSDIVAMFQGAVATESGAFEISVIVQPRDAFHLLQAERENRLVVPSRQIAGGPAPIERRCFITHRRGAERQRIEIPCTN